MTSETDAKTVLVERVDSAGGAGRVAVVTLARPAAANAFSRALVTDLTEAFQTLAAEPVPPVVILTGAGDKAFCAGADLKERRAMTLDQTRAFLTDLNAAVDRVADYPSAVIAAMGGVALGGGLELALACDLRFASAHVEMGLPEVRLGIIPGAGGTQRLARLCGIAIAKEMILTGRKITAARALELGIVSGVLDDVASLAAHARSVADEIASAGPLAIIQAKRAIDAGYGLPWQQAAALERSLYDVVLRSEDRNEGLAAFAEKRKPIYRGK